MIDEPNWDEHFNGWVDYWGELFRYDDIVNALPATSVVYGFENISVSGNGREEYRIGKGGAVFGFCAQGGCWVGDASVKWRLRAGFWFCLPDGATISLIPDEPTRLVAIQRLDFVGLRAMGGPIEARGRLRYIDRCTDTLLMPPPLKGDPCLNHLHFPPSIDQTEHTHPSLRAGIVAAGAGWCETPSSHDPLGVEKVQTPLVTGMIFSIPVDGRHNFLTGPADRMDIIAYHPDSDWGPTHDEHPMVNRTLVGGEKIDNTTGVHLEADFVIGDRRPGLLGPVPLVEVLADWPDGFEPLPGSTPNPDGSYTHPGTGELMVEVDALDVEP